MRIYTVHIHPKKKRPHENPIFIEEGFNWFAFLFHWMWALYQRVWSVAIAVLLLNVLFAYANMSQWLHPISVTAMQLGLFFIMGTHGNDLRREALKKRGYITSDIVTSDNLVGAEQRYFERYF